MIKSFSACTHEIDDINAAISEIKKQLDLDGKNHLLKHSIGIVSCFAGFIDSGVWKALAKALPFEILGITTILNASEGVIGEAMLSILVLTSDTVSFAAALSEPVTEKSPEPLKAMYQDALAKLPENDSKKLSFMLSFLPLFNKISCNAYIKYMSAISGGIPNFGSVTVDHNSDYHEAYVLSNGEYWKDRFAVLLFNGPVSPSFYVGTISSEKIFPENGIATSTAENILKTVNGKPVLDYLKTIGLSKNGDGIIAGLNSFPILVDYNDGTQPFATAMIALTPEDYVICGDTIQEGSTLSIGFFNPEEIANTALLTVKKALAQKEHHTMLIFSCVGRYFALGYNETAEFEQVRKQSEDADIRYMAAYCGGEICPVYDKNKETVNRNHGNTFVVCTF